MTADVPLILTFSASDPTSGAGLQADALTIAAMGAHPLTILTGVTAQNTVGVQRFEPLVAELVADQLKALLADCRQVSAIKTGVLGQVDTIQLVAEFKRQHPDVPLVVDPVKASGRGDAMGGADAFEALRRELIPLADLVTPNWPEGKALTGKRAPATVARALLEMGCKAVLLKGEHLEGETVCNRLYQPGSEPLEYPCERLPHQYHGSGCTLASAVAAGLAQGLALVEAVEMGLEFTHGTLSHAFEIGKGQRIPDRMMLLREMSLGEYGV